MNSSLSDFDFTAVVS